MKIYYGILYINGDPWPVGIDGKSISDLRRFMKKYAKEYCNAKKGDVIELRNIHMTEEIVKRFKSIKKVI
jgi:hypothetical protein